MTKAGCKRGRKFRAILSLILFGFAIRGPLSATNRQGGSRPSDTAEMDKSSPILKGKDPVVILGSAVAMSQEQVIEGEDGSAYILLLKVEKILSGKNPGKYVRADFANHSTDTVNASAKFDSKKAQLYQNFLASVRQGTIWKIALRPPIWISECRWLLHPAPKPGEEVGVQPTIMLPVRDSRGYPDINNLPCYAFEVQDVEVASSGK